MTHRTPHHNNTTMYDSDDDLQNPVRDELEDMIESEREDALQILQVFGPAFARSTRFWKSAFYSLLLGAVTGGIALGFFNGFTVMFDWWAGDEYQNSLESGEVRTNSVIYRNFAV